MHNIYIIDMCVIVVGGGVDIIIMVVVVCLFVCIQIIIERKNMDDLFVVCLFVCLFGSVVDVDIEGVGEGCHRRKEKTKNAKIGEE